MTPDRTRRPAAPARGIRRRQSASQQRQRLIDACISALHLYGPSRTTVAKVVAIAKLSPGIVRFYFNSKGAMLVASLRFLATEFEQRVMEPVGRLRDTPALALQKLVELYLDPEIASARKVSVWYAFWGESTARREYQEICGQKDERFAILVHELIGRMIGESGQRHLNSDAIALGLIGVLEVLWQGITFQAEDDIDRADARRRCLAYLASVFPGYFPAPTAAADWRALPEHARHALEVRHCFAGAWQIAGRTYELARSGDYLTIGLAAARVLALRDDSAIRAFHNNCPHQPHVLVKPRRGRLPGHIACPLHRLDFGLDGRALGGGEPSLAPLEVAAAAGFVFVGNAATHRPELTHSDHATDLPNDAPMPAGEFEERELAADWKLLVEQLLLHRLPGRETSGGWLDYAAPGLTIDEPHRSLRWQATIAGGSWSARRFVSVAAASTTLARQYLWPNLLLEWRSDGCQALQVVPLAPGRCRLQSFNYSWADAAGEARSRRFLARRIAGELLRLDIELAASTQAGLGVPGYAARADAPVPRAVAAFRQWLSAALDSR
jgi:TetR/AcrR family transcriptional regulator, transcriptional repressor of bet genes